MVGIILLNYNSSNKTEFCLNSIESQSFEQYKIYIADNNSTNDEILLIRELVRKFKFQEKILLFELYENIGFARANNYLIKKALEDSCKYIYILNNDVELTPYAINSFVKVIEENNNSIITNKILFRKNKNIIWFAGGTFDYKNADFKTVGYNEVDDSDFDKSYNTYWASGASSFYKNDFFEKIGFYDENFFFGQEEWDLSLRAINNNYNIIYRGDIVVFHEVGGSTKFMASFKIFLNTYNRMLFASKHLKKFDYLLFCIKYILYTFTIKRIRLQYANNIKIPYKKYYILQYRAFNYFFSNRFVNSKLLEDLEHFYNV
jgi:GT2 family glycosyltransferase